MATQWVIRLTFVTLALAFALIGVGVYLVLTQARDLTEARREVAVRNSALLYLNQSIGATNDFVSTVKDLRKTLCQGAGAERPQAGICTAVQVAEVLMEMNLAASARASATNAEEYQDVQGHYDRLLQLARTQPNLDDRRRWVSHAHEGIAYSLYRQRKLPEAVAAVRRARQADSSNDVARLTELKIRCVTEDAAAVRRDIARWRDSIGPSSSGGDRSRNAAVEALLHDQELTLLCGA